jgi:hypothetical protein
MGNKHTKQRSAKYKVKGDGASDKEWPSADSSTFGRNGTIRRRSDGAASSRTSHSNNNNNSTSGSGAADLTAAAARMRSSSTGAASLHSVTRTTSHGGGTGGGGTLMGGTGRGGSVIGDSGYGSIGRSGFTGNSGFVGGSRKSGIIGMGAGSKSVSFSSGGRSVIFENGSNTIGRCIYGYANNPDGGNNGRQNYAATSGGSISSTSGMSKNFANGNNANGGGEKAASMVGSCPKINTAGIDDTKTSNNATGSTVGAVTNGRQDSMNNVNAASAAGNNTNKTESAPVLRLGVTRGGVNVTGSTRQSMLDVSVRSGEGEQSAFVTAAGLGCADMVKMLLEIGVPPDLPDQAGLTALHAAAENGHVAVIELLIGGGVSLS